MKTRKVLTILTVALFAAVPALHADSDAPHERAWMGVLLDTAPLPDLLIKHLGLSPGQGIRIGNVHRGSPADKAGLERDDIIIGFQGKDVTDYDAFVDTVRKAGAGTEVSLAIVHLGQRQTVKFTLEPFADDVDLKYPPEPQIVKSWRPGRIFRLRPGDKNWIEIWRDGLPQDLDLDVNLDIRRFFKDLYTFHHSDGESYTITIEGDPDEDATITVQAGDVQYKTTSKHIDKLPEKYREPAEQALKDARKASVESKQEQGSWRRWPSNWRSYLDRFRRQGPPAVPSEPDEQMFDKIQEQMRELQKRLDKLEKSQKEMLDSKA